MPPKDDLERKITVLNDKNRRLQRKVEDLSYRCSMQSKVLDAGNLSTLQVLLDQIMTFVSSQTKKLMPELVYAEFDPADKIALFKFLEFLLSVHDQLSIFTVLPDELIYAGMHKLRSNHAAIGEALELLNKMPKEELVAIEEGHERLLEQIKQILEERNAS